MNALDASIREYHEVKREYLSADEDTISDTRRADIRDRLRAAANELIESAEKLVSRIDGFS